MSEYVPDHIKAKRHAEAIRARMTPAQKIRKKAWWRFVLATGEYISITRRSSAPGLKDRPTLDEITNTRDHYFTALDAFRMADAELKAEKAT